jgi:YD repeat-containing protein
MKQVLTRARRRTAEVRTILWSSRFLTLLTVLTAITGLPFAVAQTSSPTALTVTATGVITQDSTGLNGQFLGQPYVLIMSFDPSLLALTCVNSVLGLVTEISCQTSGNAAAALTTLTIPGAPTINGDSGFSSSLGVVICCGSQVTSNEISLNTAGSLSLNSGGGDGGILLLTTASLWDPAQGINQNFSYNIAPTDGHLVGFNGNWPLSFSPNIFAFSGTLATLSVSTQAPPMMPQVLGKNLGDPPCPNCNVANPINAATGNKFEAERDFSGAPITGLALTRYYNSQDKTGSAFGAAWHSTWHRSVAPISSSMVTVTRADGREDMFTLTAGVWQADPDVTSVLTSTPGGWQVVTADDTTELYAPTGQLTSVTTRSGLTTTLTYNASGQLASVTGPFGDVLTFVNDSAGHVVQMIVPDGGIYLYAYDSNNNLASVTHPDGSVRQYVYGNSSFPNALTGIIDEDGNPYASWTYDAQGRAVTSQHAGGADLTIVTYSGGTASSATDANGNPCLHLAEPVQSDEADGAQRHAVSAGRGPGVYL